MKYITIVLLLLVPILTSGNGNVNTDEIVRKLNRGQNIYYENAVIEGTLDLTRLENVARADVRHNVSYVETHIAFINCTFEGEVIAYRMDDETGIYSTVFERNVNFDNSTFNKGVCFKNTQFMGFADFGNTSYKSDASFYFVQFQSNAYFSNSKFEQNADFSYSQIYGKAHFSDAVFKGKTSFKKVLFESNAYFTMAKFGGNTVFDFARFRGDIFLDCKFDSEPSSLSTLHYGKTFTIK